MGCEETKEKIENKIEQLLHRQKAILQQIEKENKILEFFKIDELIKEKNEFVSNYLSPQTEIKKIKRPIKPNRRYYSPKTKIKSSINNKNYYKNKNDYLSIAISDARQYERNRSMAPLQNISSSELESFDYNDLRHNYNHKRRNVAKLYYSRPEFRYANKRKYEI